MKILKNNRGVAYLIVISFVILMMDLVISMKLQVNVNHQIVLNARARMQSYYLAKSGYNLSRMLLVYHKQIEKQIKKMGASATQAAQAGYQPIYKMVPLSSELLRGMLAAFPQPDGEGEVFESEEGALPEGEAPADQVGEGISMIKQDKVEEFLSFDGDFDVEISEEQSKYSLNTVSKLLPSNKSYDLYKKILISLLQQPEFKNFFKNQSRDSETLAHNIFDFADANQVINEFDQVERGFESGQYGSDAKHSVKNAKYLTLSELRLIPGMSDDIFSAMEPYLTVYHTSDKINLCLAHEDVVDAMIVHYTTESQCTSPIDPDDEEEILELRGAVLSGCPDPVEMADAINVALGLKPDDSTGSATASKSSKGKKSGAAKIPGCKVQFHDLLSDDNYIFRIRSKGVVDDVETSIDVVLDTKSSKALSWKVLYYKLQ